MRLRDVDIRALLCTIYLLSILTTCVRAELRLPTSSAITCAAETEYFDETTLSCTRCATNSDTTALVADTSTANAIGLPVSCTCKVGTIAIAQDDAICASTWPAPCSSSHVCKRCHTDEVPSRDGSRCMTCGNSTAGINEDGSDCRCNGAAAILVETSETNDYLAAKACMRCANGTRPNAARSSCERCPDLAMTPVLTDGAYVCTCDSTTHQLVASERLNVTKCVARNHMNVLNAKVTVNTASTVSFADFASATGSSSTALVFASALHDDAFVLAASECYFYRSAEQNRYCQVLGNLCVLQHFASSAAACALLDLVQRGGRTTIANDIAGWYTTLPFLSYSASTQSVLENTAIGMTMSFDEAAASGTSDHLEFMLATYAFSGALTSVARLTTQLLYCQPDVAIGTPVWARFGASTTQRYDCDLRDLDATKLELYELFVVDRSKPESDDGRYVPVPVQNLNYRDAKGFAINANSDATDVADDFLSHRFFLYDFQSGIAVGETKPRVCRYAESITLTIRTQQTNVQRIYPPLLSIAYADTQTIRTASLQFHVTYASETTRLWTTAPALFIVACGLAACRVVLQTFTWQRRSTRNEELGAALWHSMTHLVACSASNVARASFSVLFVLTTYVLVFFKLQSTVFLLLPAVNHATLATTMVDEYYPFCVLLPLAFALQLAFALRVVYTQTQAHVLFVDWEKPRAKVLDVDSATPQNAPVSIWRTILVANEWKALQVTRRTSFELTLVLLLFLLYGCDVRAAALPIPRAQMAHVSDQRLLVDARLALNPYLRFASTSCLWLLLCAAQRLWKWLIYERYIDEPRESLFIDLCTVAKVSCLVLDEPYHGFYLHCRSPYPFADGNMSEIVEQLKQEEAGLTVGRGLDSGLPECQTFEMFLTRRWKRKYQACVAAVHGGSVGAASRAAASRSRPELVRRHRPFAQDSTVRTSGAAVVTQTMVQHAVVLSDFVKAFVENQDEQFRWRIYRAQTCLSSLFGIPPEVISSKQSLFLPDTTSKFCNVLFLGIETDLMLLNILCFCTCDLWIENHAVAALVTYVLEWTLVALRRDVGAKQLARNTLIDPRFFF